MNVSPQLRSRVVVVKYERRPLSNKTLFAFSEPFGILREHLVLKNKVRSAARVSARTSTDLTAVFASSGVFGVE